MYDYVCEDCGHSEKRVGNDPRTQCERCGSQRFSILIEFVDKISSPLEEMSAAAEDSAGEIIAERISKTDGNTSSELVSDLGHPALITSKRYERVAGFQEEGIAAEALAVAFNSSRKTSYRVKEKKKEDSDYADRVFESTSDTPGTIDIQIRHLDTKMVERINRFGEFVEYREIAELHASINESIKAKSKVDSALKARTILLLQIPAPLGTRIRRQIQRSSFDTKGFKEIWIGPNREEFFKVFPPLLHGMIAATAYELWEAEGPFWANDQSHWFKAIDRLRAL